MIQTIDAYISKFLTFIGYGMPGFKHGVMTGLVGILVLIILLKILCFIFRKKEKRCSGLYTTSENGNLYISKAAIADLVKAKETEVQGISIVKTYLIRKRRNYSIKIIADLSGDDGSFPELVSRLQDKILSGITDNLGITTISKVDLVLRRVKPVY